MDRTHKKYRYLPGFTLVEMLIVIVIIGILASALIPRLSQARERANDTARRAHLQNVATVLIAYQIDKGQYPSTPGSLSSISGQLLGAGLSSVPTDPVATRVFSGVGTTPCLSTTGQYMYTPISKGGISGAGFALMAGTQTEGGSNYVFTGSNCISINTNFNAISECGPGNPCSSEPGFVEGTDQFRYIYRQ